MDFHLATPTGDVYLFSYDGRQVQVLAEQVFDAIVADSSAVEPKLPTPSPT